MTSLASFLKFWAVAFRASISPNAGNDPIVSFAGFPDEGRR